MKIKNLAFYGVMAAILGSVGTARADGAADSTIIASKGYVDAYAQKQADRVTKTWDDPTLTSTDKTSETLYPSMKTLNDAITNVTDNQAQSDWNETVTTSPAYIQNKPTIPVVDQTYGPSSANAQSGVAVASAIAGKEDTTNKQAAQPGATVTRWDTTAAEGTDAYTSDTKYPTVKAVAQQIAQSVSGAVDDGPNALELTDSSTTAPSVTAVKGITDNTTTAYTARDSNNQLTGSGSTTKVPTTAAVVTALKDLDMTEITGADSTNHELDYGKPVVSLSQVDGKVYGALGQVGTAGIMDYAVRDDKLANNAVTVRSMGAKELAGDAIDSTTNQLVKWNASNNNPATPGYAADDKFPTVKAVAQQIAAGAVAPHGITGFTGSNVHSIVKYNDDGLVIGGVDLDNTLNNINVASGGSAGDNACSAENPCVLSYIGGNTYKWTQMATEGLSARADQTSGS